MPTLLELTTEKLHEKVQDDRADAMKTIADGDLANPIKTYREYAAGKQGCTLTEALASFVEGITGQRFCDNVMDQVLGEAAARIFLEGFNVDPPGFRQGQEPAAGAVKAAEDVDAFLRNDVYIKCALADRNNVVNYNTFRDARFALMPWWAKEEDRLVIYLEEWWDGESGMYVKNNEWGGVEYAVKEWTEAEDEKTFQRRTVFLDDRILRYRRANSAGEWEPFQLRVFNKRTNRYEEDPWPVPWRKLNGKPLHVPVVEYMNGGRGSLICSDLAGGVTGNQDHFTDLRWDLKVACRMTAYQMYYITNYKPMTDRPGNELPLMVGPGMVLKSKAPPSGDPPLNTQFGVLPAGDLSQLINAYDLILRAICRMTRTPMHRITGGDWPSGDALWQAEQPAINKAKAQLQKLIPSWATLAHRCVEIANAFGGLGLNEDAMITPKFADVEQLGELKQAMAAREFWTAAKTAVDAGYPLSMYLEDAGWSKETIDKLEEKLAEQEREAMEQDALTVDRMTRAAEAAGNRNGRERVPA